jgi:hypothetical protein
MRVLRQFQREVRRIPLPGTPVHGLLFALLLHNRYYWHLGDGSRPPLLAQRKTGRLYGLMAPDRTVL